MAYRRMRRKKKFYGMRKSRFGRKNRFRKVIAKKTARKAYRRMIRLPKRIVVKKYANTIGQLAYKSRRSRPSHRRY